MTAATAGKSPTTIPYFKLDAGKFFGEVAGLPHDEVGVYIRLMCIYWEEGCRLPAEHILCRRLGLRTDKQKDLLRAVLDTFFTGEGRHERLDQCLVEASGISKRQSDNANKGWETRKARSSVGNSQLPEPPPQDKHLADF